MKLKEFYYDLPEELIAQEPLKERAMSRLMVLDRAALSIKEKLFRDITEYFRPGDCLVLNDTRVIPVRLYGKRKTGGRVEIFLLNPESETPRALVRPSKRVKEGEDIELDNGGRVTILGAADAGRFVLFHESLENILAGGHMPLPPYISRDDRPRDREDYQTVYACHDGATASPAAGLHFTEELLDGLRGIGVTIASITLHTSYGTFAPVKVENIEDHVMHPEIFKLDKENADRINNSKEWGGRIFAVGTTSTRVLETSATDTGKVAPGSGETNLFIYPGYKYKIVNKLITNFHLPESTLLMLVSALAGKEFVMKSYAKAINSKFRFFSYGDAMLVL